MSDALDIEAKSMEELLVGKTVSEIFRHKESEVCIQFSDGTKLFVDTDQEKKLEFSITGA